MSLTQNEVQRVVHWLRQLEKLKTTDSAYFVNNMTSRWMINKLLQLNTENKNLNECIHSLEDNIKMITDENVQLELERDQLKGEA